MLFALSLNITLVVHDKINLQNSVDIAAYYGAMKQAEMLNAIAHINYQIRQSWKLLSWRYRVLGNAGFINLGHINPRLYTTARPIETEPHKFPVFFGASPTPGPYFFCAGHKYWGSPTSFTGYRTTEDMWCINMGHGGSLRIPGTLTYSGNLGDLSTLLDSMQSATERIRERIAGLCKTYSVESWRLGAYTFFHYLTDQSMRKTMIYYLAKNMSEGEHGKDMDGDPIKIGVEKSFKKNLTYINKKNYEDTPNGLKQFNSLTGITDPGSWLIDNPLHLKGLYSKFTKIGGECKRDLALLHDLPNPAGITDPYGFKDKIHRENPWPACARGKDLCQASAGLRKIRINEDLKKGLIFYGVKAELDYERQIFLPFGFGNGNVKLRAVAFAKPFGGTIGPTNDKDPRLPDRGRPMNPNPLYFDDTIAPNYSKYPGDIYGLKSSYTHNYWSGYIRESPKELKNIKNYLKKKYLTDRDPLVREHEGGAYKTFLPRKWEIMAISPDLFDITYFTILPYYMYTYFHKIKGLLSGIEIRGDLGTLFAGRQTHKPGILYQVFNTDLSGYLKPSRFEGTVWSDRNFRDRKYPGITPAPFYKIHNLSHLLTGWNPLKNKYTLDGDNYFRTPPPVNIMLDQTLFAKCKLWVHDSASGVNKDKNPKGKIATGCIYGGRMGYSVKMISKEYLKGWGDDNILPPWIGL